MHKPQVIRINKVSNKKNRPGPSHKELQSEADPEAVEAKIVKSFRYPYVYHGMYHKTKPAL